jgi:hypothetical protein
MMATGSRTAEAALFARVGQLRGKWRQGPPYVFCVIVFACLRSLPCSRHNLRNERIDRE